MAGTSRPGARSRSWWAACAIALCALLAGGGGLLFELLAFRRFGLAAGNTAAASAWVLGGYLFGLSVGGVLVYRRLHRGGAIGAPLGWACGAYLLVALLGTAADVWVAGSGPADGLALVAVWAGMALVPPIAMGAAFPLLFASRHAPGPGLLVGANLLGSVVAAWAGGNWLIPEFGMAWTRWLAGGCYLAAAGWLAIVSESGRDREVDEGLETRAGRAGAVDSGAGEVANAAPAGSVVRLAAAAGFVTLGFEAYLLRRLPFFLEGFQPTLSGVLAAVLLALTVGAAVVPSVFRRAVARDPLGAAAWALVVGAVLTCCGATEHLVPRLARWPVASEVGLHLRVAWCALVAAGPAAVALGAVVPMVLRAGPPGAARGRLAGAAYFGHGVGALFGALTVGHALPLLVPTHYHAVAVPIVAAIGLLMAWRGSPSSGSPSGVALLVLVLLLGGLSAGGLAGAGSPWSPKPPIAGSRYDHPDHYRHLSFRTDPIGTASVSYDERHHSMLLFTGEFRAAETGPATDYMRALGQLPFLLRAELPKVAVIALGTGTTATALSDWSEPAELHVVELSRAVLDQVAFFTGDGPLRAGSMAPAWQLDPRTRVHLTDGRRFLAQRPPGSLDLVTMEPLLPYAPGTVPLYTREFYRLAAAALDEDGLCVQWVPTHAMPRVFFETLLATFARSFEHSSAWLVDSATLLVGSARPHAPDFGAIGQRIERAPAGVRAALHRSGLARAVDFDVAYVGDRIAEACAKAPDLVDDRPFLERIGYWDSERKLRFLANNLGVLQRIAKASAGESPNPRDAARVERLGALADLSLAVLEHPASNEAASRSARKLAGLRSRWPDSVLLYREAGRALRRSVERELVQTEASLAARLARRQLERSPNSPLLQAYAAGQAGPSDDRSLAERNLHLRTARALDPGIGAAIADPALRTRLAGLASESSPLAELFQLPTGDGLVEVATGSRVTARTLRAMFPVRVGRALVDLLRRGPLSDRQASALRACADPLLIELGVRAILARSGELFDELGPVWRRDLPLPPSLLAALQGATRPDRLALAAALERRRGPRARRALAQLMVDPDLAVREAAAATLFTNFRSRVAYDPRWAPARLEQAAAAIRR